jgi:hypothetical protein
LYTREEAVDKAEMGTFSWILGNHDSDLNRTAGSTFKEWLQQDGSAHTMFWISGKPASGKSTLMKHIHTYERKRLELFLSQWTCGSPPVIAGFYFSAESSTQQGKTQEGLLKALLHQILTQMSTEACSGVLGTKLRTQDWVMGSFTRPSAVHWRLNELRELFRSTTTQAQGGQHIYIFADGLDEYYSIDNSGHIIQAEDDEEDDADIRLEGQSEIAELFLEISGNPYVKICVASRSQQPFEELFQRITFTGLRLRMEDLTRADIESLVDKRLGQNIHMDRLQVLEPGFKDKLIQDVVAKANGVFTWVNLITRRLHVMLSNGDRAEIRDYLECVPARLGGQKGLYMSLLRGIRKQYRLDTVRLLKAVMNARYPQTAVTLSFCEVDSAEVVQTPVQKWSHEELEAEARRMELRIQSRCAGILELAPNPRRNQSYRSDQGHINSQYVVRFIHLTARQFLQNKNAWDVLLGVTDE